MHLPLSFLKQFVNIDKTPEQIAEKLTFSGSEVEKIVRRDKGLDKIVVGLVKEISPHPEASKLRLTKIDVGKIGLLEIVCGAFNFKVGDKVPCVLVGGSVPGLKIEAREIRGIASQGMLASERELGIGEDHSGIFILPSDAKPGEDAVKLLELDEPVLELEITPNRPDCFSVRGLAREVSALTGRKLQVTSYKLQERGQHASSTISVKIEDKELCPKYCARAVQDVKVGPSPLWLANRLRQMGVRSINNVVDITNYVMMELGHPLHAFDAELLEADARGSESGLKRIIVRNAKRGEKIAALDEQTYELNPDMLVIADSKKAVAIAGVMGGMETRVTDKTKNIVLEAAVFNPVSIRKTSKALNLRSESSARFEKGVDFEAVEEAITRAAQMIEELAGGKVLRGIVSQESKQKEPGIIKLKADEVKRLLGVEVASAKVKSILESLGFKVSGSSALSVKVPSWRVHDVSVSADLAEEIGRIMDYNSLPKTLPTAVLESPEADAIHSLRRNLRHYLVSAGYSEILTYSFYDEAAVKRSQKPKSDHVLLTNPVNDEYPYLRTSLLPWMQQKLSQNSSLLSRDAFQIFEMGKIFERRGAERRNIRAERGERWQASIGLIDAKTTDEGLYRELRGLLEGFVGDDVEVKKDGDKYLVLIAKEQVASIQIWRKGAISGLRFRTDAGVLLIDIEKISQLKLGKKIEFKPLPYYPVVERDLGVVAPNVVQYKEIESYISKFNPLIKKLELFDVYHGLEAGDSLAIRLTFSSTDRTLEAKEVDEIIDKLKLALVIKFKVNYR